MHRILHQPAARAKPARRIFARCFARLSGGAMGSIRIATRPTFEPLRTARRIQFSAYHPVFITKYFLSHPAENANQRVPELVRSRMPPVTTPNEPAIPLFRSLAAALLVLAAPAAFAQITVGDVRAAQRKANDGLPDRNVWKWCWD
jgi:hypothetical protein